MKRWIPILMLVAIASLSPAPIKDTRPLNKQPELSDAQKEQQMQGARMNEVGVVPEIVDRPAAVPIDGDSEAAGIVRTAGEQEAAAEAAKKGAAAVQEASREIAQRDKPNWGRIFFGGLIVVAAFGLFQVFRMWANKNLPDAPASYR